MPNAIRYLSPFRTLICGFSHPRFLGRELQCSAAMVMVSCTVARTVLWCCRCPLTRSQTLPNTTPGSHSWLPHPTHGFTQDAFNVSSLLRWWFCMVPRTVLWCCWCTLTRPQTLPSASFQTLPDPSHQQLPTRMPGHDPFSVPSFHWAPLPLSGFLSIPQN